MAARRCALCDINYPPDSEFAECPVHGRATQWMSALNADSNWDWKATAILVSTQQKLQRIASPPRQRSDGLYEVRRSMFQPRLGDGDVFEAARREPSPDDGPCDCLWEVLFDTGDVYIVRPIRVPDAPDGN